jgi:hypothetical protein
MTSAGIPNELLGSIPELLRLADTIFVLDRGERSFSGEPAFPISAKIDFPPVQPLKMDFLK